MFLVSKLLDHSCQLCLKSGRIRQQLYKRVLQRRLRQHRLGRILLRNLHTAMADNPSYHDEFRRLCGDGDYQKGFWESDMGFLWYAGNLHRRNDYFDLALQEIKQHRFSSHLDVGCGWGELGNRTAALEEMHRVVGIDISEKIISDAKERHPHSKAQFLCMRVEEITENFDLVTAFSCSDYIAAEKFLPFLEKLLQCAKRMVLLTNSLRGIAFNQAVAVNKSELVRRYDWGYVHPLQKNLEKLQAHIPFEFTVKPFGLESQLARVVLQK